MHAFGITVKDLQPPKDSKGARSSGSASGTGDKRRAAGASKKAAGSAVAAKYRGPEGQTWSGRGLTPRWLTSLVEQGRSKEEFLISPSS
jgi:DNA-binding protein H-NS